MSTSSVKERTLYFIKYKGLTMKEFESLADLSTGYVTSMRKSFGDQKLSNVLKAFPELNRDWLLYGEGEMLKTEKPLQEIKEVPFEDAHKYPKGVLIPYFADTHTRGGLTDRQAPTDIEERVTSYIESGSLFANATSAIKHFGDSMVEYPSGCVLFCRKVENPSLLVNGSPYVIETTEYRVTKKIHDKGEFIRAFSTNEQKFPDGSLVYAPFDIPKTEIIRMHQILGYAYIHI